MTIGLRSQWILWVVLVATVLAGVIADDLSSAKLVTLELRPNTSVVVDVFRPLPHALNLSLIFNRANWEDKRPELGDSQTKGGAWQETGYLEFPRPGVPIKLLIQGEDNEAIYEALPAGSYNANTKGRDLEPFVDDGNPNRIPWPPIHSLKPVLPSGYSTIKISVLEVGAELLGEQATLIVESPVSFKSTAPGYGFLWWFMFWPLYALLLIIYGAILFWMSLRSKDSNLKVGIDSP